MKLVCDQIDIFTEEMIRAGSAASLSQLLNRLDPVIRKEAHMGRWMMWILELPFHSVINDASVFWWTLCVFPLPNEVAGWEMGWKCWIMQLAGNQPSRCARLCWGGGGTGACTRQGLWATHNLGVRASERRGRDSRWCHSSLDSWHARCAIPCFCARS